MSEKRDYYELLGLARDASTDDIRKAYRKLALKYHPDRNAGSREAEAKFKEVTEAYQVLSDPDKRDRYDRFGHAGVEGSIDFGADIFSHFQDIFSEFFGGLGGFGGGPRRRNGPRRGQDLRVEQTLSLEEAVAGCKKELSVRSPAECEECGGTGAEPGTEPITCSTCHGAGQVSSGRGFVVFTQTCPSCGGEGTVIETPCDTCGGAGWTEQERKVLVTFPPGIDTGHRLRVGGQGVGGRRGGPSGDLYVDVIVEPHERFKRDGIDLLTRQTVSFPDAALGTTRELTLIDGTVHELEVPRGVQPGQVLTVPGKGAPRVDGRAVGSLHVLIQVEVPKRLSRRAKKLLKELDAELGRAAVSAEESKSA